jgi:hypothetical protein
VDLLAKKKKDERFKRQIKVTDGQDAGNVRLIVRSSSSPLKIVVEDCCIKIERSNARDDGKIQKSEEEAKAKEIEKIDSYSAMSEFELGPWDTVLKRVVY